MGGWLGNGVGKGERRWSDGFFSGLIEKEGCKWHLDVGLDVVPREGGSRVRDGEDSLRWEELESHSSHGFSLFTKDHRSISVSNSRRG